MQVLQTSIFLKYRPLFTFLQRHASSVANELQRAYVGAARTYYETGFRRYIRSLGYVKVLCSLNKAIQSHIHGCQARAVENADLITAGAGEAKEDADVDFDRLGNSRINGPNIVLTHIAEDKSYVSILLWRSCYRLNITTERAYRGSGPIIAPCPHGQRQCGIHFRNVILLCRVPRTHAPTTDDWVHTFSCLTVIAHGRQLRRWSLGRRLGLWCPFTTTNQYRKHYDLDRP